MEEIMIALAEAVDKERAAKDRVFAFLEDKGLTVDFVAWAIERGL